MEIQRKIGGAAWKLARRYGAELEEVESRLNFYFINALHHHPYNPDHGGTEDAYNGIVLANAVHRVSRELLCESRRKARTVSLDEMLDAREEVLDA